MKSLRRRVAQRRDNEIDQLSSHDSEIDYNHKYDYDDDDSDDDDEDNHVQYKTKFNGSVHDEYDEDDVNNDISEHRKISKNNKLKEWRNTRNIATDSEAENTCDDSEYNDNDDVEDNDGAMMSKKTKAMSLKSVEDDDNPSSDEMEKSKNKMENLHTSTPSNSSLVSPGKVSTPVEHVTWTDGFQNPMTRRLNPSAGYKLIMEKARGIVSSSIQCSMFCGGKNCKYESGTKWPDESKAFDGIFSHWVTENILATARPNEDICEKGLIEQMYEAGIRSIFNLQQPGEHAKCGQPLHSSGFSYNPQKFMDADIFFYNFAWEDYGIGSLQNILDIVKVFLFAVGEGKVAVHCHAGLGRTGVLIACYLVLVNRLHPNEAIHFVRSKRPGSIQTREQMLCIHEFSRYIAPLRIIFATDVIHMAPGSLINETSSVTNGAISTHDHLTQKVRPFTLQQALQKQKCLLHGYESRYLKYTPRIVVVCCPLLLKILSNNNEIIPIMEKHLTKINKLWSEITQDEKLSSRSSKVTGSLPDLLETRNDKNISSKQPLKSKPKSAALFYANSQTSINSSHAEDLTDFNSDDDDISSADGDFPLSQNQQERITKRREQSLVEKEKNVDKEMTPMMKPRVPKRRMMPSSPSIEPDITKSNSSLTHSSHWTNLQERRLSTFIQQIQNKPLDMEEKLSSLRFNLNNDWLNEWKSLKTITEPVVIWNLLLNWFDHLKQPVFTAIDLAHLLEKKDDVKYGIASLDRGTGTTLLFLADFVSRLLKEVILRTRVNHKFTLVLILHQLFNALTHSIVPVNETILESYLSPSNEMMNISDNDKVSTSSSTLSQVSYKSKIESTPDQHIEELDSRKSVKLLKTFLKLMDISKTTTN